MHIYRRIHAIYAYFCGSYSFYMQFCSPIQLFHTDCKSTKDRIYYQNHTIQNILLSKVKSGFNVYHLLKYYKIKL